MFKPIGEGSGMGEELGAPAEDLAGFYNLAFLGE